MKKRLPLLLLLALLGATCAALATWIIMTSPITGWQPKLAGSNLLLIEDVPETVSVNFQPETEQTNETLLEQINENCIKDRFTVKVKDANGTLFTGFTVSEANYVTLDGHTALAAGGKAQGGTYLAIVTLTIDTEFRGIYEWSTEISSPNLRYTNTLNVQFSALLKYQTVQLVEPDGAVDGEGNAVDKSLGYFTPEDALNASASPPGSIAIVETDTSFAYPAVAALAGYLPAEGEENSCYQVKNTLLVPYAEKAMGYISTGTIDSKAVNGDSASDRAAATTFSKNYTTSTDPIAAEPISREGGFAKLTLPAGVQLSVEEGGHLVVNAVVVSSNSNPSRVNGGYYGELELAQNAAITLEDGAVFDCIGFAYGEGRIEAKSGSQTYELFNMPGWKGGSDTVDVYGGMSGGGIFPLSQYTVSSLMVRSVFRHGALYNLKGFVAGASQYAYADVGFVSPYSGSGDETPTFLKSKSGTITKWVTKEDGKLHFELEGNVEVQNLSLSLELLGIPMSIGTAGLQVPVPGHLELSIKSGTATIPEGVALKMLPGAHVIVQKNAHLTIAGTALAYGANNRTGDEKDFTDYGWDYPHKNVADVYRFEPTTYPEGDDGAKSHGLGYTDASPARVEVYEYGELNVTETATVAAEIEGRNGARLHVATGATVSGKIKECRKTAKESDFVPEFYFVDVKSFCWNADAQEGQTHGTWDVEAGSWSYSNGQWSKPDHFEVRYHLNGGTIVGLGDGEVVKDPVEVWLGLINEVRPRTPARPYYRFEGWFLDESCSDEQGPRDLLYANDAETIAAGIDLYAKWTPIVYTVYGVIDGKEIELGTWSAAEMEPLNLMTKTPHAEDGMEFKGWFFDSEHRSETIGELSEDTIGQVLERVDGSEGAGTIRLYGYFAAAGSVTVVIKDSAPSDTEGYPGYGEKTKVGVTKDQTYEAAGLPTDDRSGFENDVTAKYYFAGWFTQGGTEVFPKQPVNPKLAEDGTITIEAKWVEKLSLTITLSYQNPNSIFGNANAIGFELTYQEKSYRETLSVTKGANNAERKEYVYWMKETETFTLRFFYADKKQDFSEEGTTEVDDETAQMAEVGLCDSEGTLKAVSIHDVASYTYYSTVEGARPQDFVWYQTLTATPRPASESISRDFYVKIIAKPRKVW